MKWSSGASIPGPHAFQACALPTELLDRDMHNRLAAVMLAVPTGFEPATSGLTGRRELHFTTGPDRSLLGTPNGIRTRAVTLKG